MSASSNVNPTFSIKVVKISKDSWFYFAKQVSFWVRDGSLWANGARVWEFQGAFALGTFSFHAPDLCGPWWPADGSHHHPSRHQCLDRPCKTMAKIPKIIILGYGKGDSCQISPIKHVNNLFSGSPINLLRRACTLRHRAEAPRWEPIKNCGPWWVPWGGSPFRDCRSRSCDTVLEFISILWHLSHVEIAICRVHCCSPHIS